MVERIYGINLLQFKLICCFVIAVVAAIGVLSPYWVGEARKKIVSKKYAFGNCLTAGVLLSGSLVHLLPDAIVVIGAYGATSCAGGAAVFLTVLGELATLLHPTATDEIHVPKRQTARLSSYDIFVHNVVQHITDSSGACIDCNDAERERITSRTGTPSAGSPRDDERTWTLALPRNWTLVRKRAYESAENRIETKYSGRAKGIASTAQPVLGTVDETSRSLDNDPDGIETVRAIGSSRIVQPKMGHSPQNVTPRGEARLAVSSLAGKIMDRSPDLALPLLDELPFTRRITDHSYVPEFDPQADIGAEIRSYCLFLALSFHSIMEGVGIGSATTPKMVGPIFLAVLAHKGLTGFALGNTLLQAAVATRAYLVMVVIFSLCTPIGIGLGIGISNAGSIWSGAGIALASGTFLQVSLLEVTARAMGSCDHKVPKCAGLATGFVCMTVLGLWT